jgi:uncharacterized membrane protein YsdA (DUF1294 family)/cold shock CspA family protein
MSEDKKSTVPSSEQHGVVVKWDAEKGYGFIRPDGAKGTADQDVFVHVRNVEGRRDLTPGQGASYHLTRTDKGLAAINVRPGSVLGTPYLKFTIIGIGSALLLLLGFVVILPQSASPALWLALWVAALSIAAFGVYGYDKGQAQRGGGRVPEVVLWLLAALGGSPGAFIAMRVFHHKTSKTSFQIVFWVIVAAQVALIALLLLRG